MALCFSSYAGPNLPAMERNTNLEAECMNLPSDALPEKRTQCNVYYTNLSNTADERIRACRKDQECVDTETENKFSITSQLTKISNRSAQLAVDGAMAGATCERLAKEAKAKIKQKGVLNAEGSEALYSCIKLSKGYFRSLYNRGTRNGGLVNWQDLIMSSDQCVEDALKECGKVPSQSASIAFRTGLQTCYENHKEQAAKCDAAAFLISLDKNFENAEDNKPDTHTDKTLGIVCSSKGIETLDYAGCVKFVQNAGLMEAAQTAIHQGQTLYYADKTMSAQADAAKSDNTASAALTALKSGVQSQKEIMEQRAALDAGKLAALASMYMDIPDLDTLKQKCNRYSVPMELSGVDKPCDNAILVQPGFGFLLNQSAKEKMKAKLVSVGINVASDAVMADLMAKRESDLNKAIANVESFKPIDPIAPQADNLQTTFCQANPGDPKCLTGGLDRTLDMMNDNVITFGEGGTGTSYANANPFKDPGSTNTNAVSPTSRNSVTGVGSAISSANQGGGLANPIAAGTITKGNGPTGGGGGGGGSAGGGAGGGGGGGAPAAQNQGGVSAAIGGRPPTYNGGSGFSLVGGGNGLRAKKAGSEKEENPFGKLFGKNNNANGTVNFREIASQKVGSKGDNIFDMISKRYSTVAGDKRLIEYELAK